ncbi:MAG TPA: helix-turn-helix domain-containing protein [Segeticoccus sp.]|uniref:helix-turn-helix domain-containing protein n=1 Tax=Segeticoccus sp. TaxID=2706531 RepID=UPI002D7FE3F5|nr:helix-turn-helix domain-containing protein [Segeticoccus sp.]HET8599293.1 helix-turn-helix domain-containing protein [Segeticoccus sp.]
MSTATDTFAAFLAVLADGLADADGKGPEHLPCHEADGAAIAARLHLSRFHLDRVVSSVAGEPPQRFRRRVLLERAAYRLVTTDHSILDVAVEAGYGSHEAFTRAFTRAYGRTPRDWRRAPGTIRIAAPSDVHFHPPGSLRLPARRLVTPMDLLTRMVEHHIWLTGEMIDRAARLSDSLLDEVIELDVDADRQTLRSLLSRLVGQMGMWNAALANREYDWSVEEHESIAGLRQRLADEGPTYLAHVREVCENGRLDDTFVDALCEPAEVFTYGGMVAHVLTFAAHRRTLVALALDHAGITDLGWGDPMRWVAEPVG